MAGNELARIRQRVGSRAAQTSSALRVADDRLTGPIGFLTVGLSMVHALCWEARAIDGSTLRMPQLSNSINAPIEILRFWRPELSTTMADKKIKEKKKSRTRPCVDPI
jgi:hypothetical protein